jgi:hypothetical protein
MFERIMGVFKLDSNTFEAIEHDSAATTQAAMIVAIVALFSGLGSGIGAAFAGNNFLIPFISSLIWAFVGWLLWALVTYFVGTSFFGGKATVEEMLRVIGFAQAPSLLAIIPCVGWIIGLIWALAAGFVAVRQGLDLDNMKAFFTVAIGFVLVVIGNIVLSMIFGMATSFFN